MNNIVQTALRCRLSPLPPKLQAKILDLELQMPNSRALQDLEKSAIKHAKSSYQTYNHAHDGNSMRGRPKKIRKPRNGSNSQDTITQTTPNINPESLTSTETEDYEHHRQSSPKLHLNLDNGTVSNIALTTLTSTAPCLPSP
jgi:hypothetical protein